VSGRRSRACASRSLCSLPGRECPAVDETVWGLERFDVGEDLLLLLFERLDLVLDRLPWISRRGRTPPGSASAYSFVASVASFGGRDQRQEHGAEGGNAMIASPSGFAAIAALNPLVAIVAAIVEA